MSEGVEPAETGMHAALRVEGLTKIYPTAGGVDPVRLLWRSLRGATPRGEAALNDVSFSVPRGSALGVIGRNGSGKSTLLRILAGGLHATGGNVHVEGRIGTLLDLTSGINPDFTGTENALLLGMLAGHTRRHVAGQMQAIRDFSGLGDAFARPVKSYSAGMSMRLAFSAAIHMDPDVLLIDEALAVGDSFFQQRCMRRMHAFRSAGKTIVLVSHDPSAIISLCDRALWLERGEVAKLGEPDAVVRQYLAARYQDDCALEAPLQDAGPSAVTVATGWIEPARSLGPADERFGDGRARITGVALRDEAGRELGIASAGEPVQLVVTATAHDPIRVPLIGFTLRNRLGDVVTATNSEHEETSLPPLRPGQQISVAFSFLWPAFASADYAISPALADGSIDSHVMCDWVENPLIVQSHNPRALFGWYSLGEVSVQLCDEAAAEEEPPPRADSVIEGQEQSSSRILGAVEEPSAVVIDQRSITSDRRLFVSGWAFSSDGKQLVVRARVGDAASNEVVPTGFRDDVARDNPGVPTSGCGGFGLLVELPEQGGPARLIVEASAEGDPRVLADLTLELPGPRTSAEPPLFDGRAARFAGPAKKRGPDRPRRILFVSHNFNLQGAPRSLLDMATRLDPERFESSVLSPADGPLHAAWKERGIETEVEALGVESGGIDDYQAAIRRAAALRSPHAPDLIVANTLDAFWAVDLARELGVPVIWIVRESESPATYFYARLPTAIAQWATSAFARASRMVFVSRATEQMFEPVLARGQSRVIHNGLDLTQIDHERTSAPVRKIRKRLGLPQEAPILLCVGTPCQRKGQLQLLHALGQLRARETPPFCVFLGTSASPYLDAMQTAIENLGLAERVLLVPETPDPLPYYQAADLLVCPSFQESLPRVVLEAMAFSLPVVASDVHGIPELIRDREEGLLFAPGDEAALAAALDSMLDDPAQGVAMGAASRRRLEASFTLDRTVRSFAELFDELLAAPAQMSSGMPSPRTGSNS